MLNDQMNDSQTLLDERIDVHGMYPFKNIFQNSQSVSMRLHHSNQLVYYHSGSMCETHQYHEAIHDRVHHQTIPPIETNGV